MIIGRDREIKVLRNAIDGDSSEFIAIYGRRRIGKTYLVREVCGDNLSFAHTGVANAPRTEQLARFASSLKKHGFSFRRKPRNWFDAFDILEAGLAALPTRRKIVFIDELPWMDSPKSNFVSALEAFWNGWASARKDVVLVVCGSATSWIIGKIIDSHGGLHNRITHSIKLEPFTLAECELFAKAKGIVATRMHILEYYMAMGGVAYYWNFLEKGKSPAQNIQSIFFAANGELRREYGHLYASLFRKPKTHIAVVEALGTKKAGMTRTEIVKAAALSDNGELSVALGELAECGFIRRYCLPGRKSHDSVYQLVDNFTLFHFRFLAELDEGEEGSWPDLQGTPRANVWRGLSFERVCLLHAPQIKCALGISGIRTRLYAWRSRRDADIAGEKNGAQIDLIVERADDAVNICEMKYSAGEYEIGKEEHRIIMNRRERFLSETGFRGAAYLTYVTTSGLANNAYRNDVQSEITLDDLFKE